jgi:hypothetical protein
MIGHKRNTNRSSTRRVVTHRSVNLNVKRLAERHHFRDKPRFRDGAASDAHDKFLDRRAVFSHRRLYLRQGLLERLPTRLRFAAGPEYRDRPRLTTKPANPVEPTRRSRRS